MELPVVINALDDGAPLPERADYASHPPRLVPRMKTFVHGDTLQSNGICLGDESPAPTEESGAPSPSPALGAHVASLYRSLVQTSAPRKRTRYASVTQSRAAVTPRRVSSADPIVVHSSDSESSAPPSAASVPSAPTGPTVAAATAHPPPASASADVFLCEWCATEVPRDGAEEHLRSTVHRFNMQYRPARGHYYLNESNAGYRMLKAMHWQEEEGLGAQGQGRLEPIRTRLKNDRVGVGGPSGMPLRVTHDAAEVEAQAKRRALPTRVPKEEKRRGRAGKGRREQRAAATQERLNDARLREEVYADYPLL